MLATYADLARQAADLRREIRAIRQGRAAPSWASPPDLAAALGLDLDGWQHRVVASTARRTVVKAPRQSGKSLCAAVVALFTAVTIPEALVLVIAPAQRQSMELARVVRRLAARLGLQTREQLLPVAPTDRFSLTSVSMVRLEFAHGSRLLCLPGSSESTIRGFSAPDLVVADEASRLSEESFAAVRPMMASRPSSRLILISTPWVRAGTFYAACTDGSGLWERHLVALADCRLDPAFLAEEERTLPGPIFRREYLAEFVDADDAAFDSTLIEGAVDPALTPILPGVSR